MLQVVAMIRASASWVGPNTQCCNGVEKHSCAGELSSLCLTLTLNPFKSHPNPPLLTLLLATITDLAERSEAGVVLL